MKRDQRATETDRKCLQYETLRLYTPILHITRCTTTPQFLDSHPIPANTNVFVAPSLIHVSPTLYGPDPLTFRPTRWLRSPETEHERDPHHPQPSADDTEEMIDPPKGTFLPFSGGPRACPGQKMSQVEFVSVIRAIFSRWKVAVAIGEGETDEEASRRLRKVVEGSQPKITLQVRDPTSVRLQWVERCKT